MNDFFEKTLEDIIYENRDLIKSRGLDIFYKNCARQFRISGRLLDMITWETNKDTINCRIIELKKNKLSIDNALQLLEYHTVLVLSLAGCFKKINVELVLIGSEYSKDIQNIAHISNIFRIFKYKYGFDGVQFEDCSFTNNFLNDTVLCVEKDNPQSEVQIFFKNEDVKN